MTRIFVGGPFKALVDPRTGIMREPHRTRFQELIRNLELDGLEVYNAHRREQWGAAFLSPEECTKLDFEEIRSSDLFVALLGAEPTPGTHIELGWASALGKPIVLVLDKDASYAFLLRGLHTVADVTYLEAGPDDDPAALALAAVRRTVHKPK